MDSSEFGNDGKHEAIEAGAMTKEPVAGKFLEYGGNKYFPYTSEFTDEEDNEKRFSFHFRRPMRQHMIMISKVGATKAFDAQKDVLLQLVYPPEKAALDAALDQFIMLTTSFSDEVFKRAGMGSVFVGK